MKATLQVGTRLDWLSSQYAESSFQNIREIFPTRRVKRGQETSELLSKRARIVSQGARASKSLRQFLKRNDVAGFILLKNGDVVAEEYRGEADESTLFLWFSVSKSIVSLLVGICLAEGGIRDLKDTCDSYVPDLERSVYGRTRIRDVLRMGSGVSFSEDYENPNSDVANLVKIVLEGKGGVLDYCGTLSRAARPGALFNYSSMETEVLGAVLAAASECGASDYLSTRLWKVIGAEHEAAWILDQPGRFGKELVSAGLCATVRDIARVGRLIATNGRLLDAQLIPRSWLRTSMVPHGAAFGYGRVFAGTMFGYGYHWWVLNQPRPIVAAMGVFGQMLIIDKANGLVMVCASAWPRAFMPERIIDVINFFSAIEVETEVRRVDLRVQGRKHSARYA